MTDLGLTLNPVLPGWLIMLLIIFLSLAMLWKETRSRQKFLVGRIIADGLVLVSILGLILQPSLSEKKEYHPVLLLTRGYSKHKADSIMTSDPSTRVIMYGDASPYPSAESATSSAVIIKNSDEIKTIMGEGLPGYILDQFAVREFSFVPSGDDGGIEQIFIPKVVRANRTVSVRGAYRNTEGESVTLRLQAPDGTEDSVILKGRGRHPFSFSFIPKQAGRFSYSMATKTAKGIKVEKLPIEIMADRELKILVLQKYPTAEVRHLKNLLAEKGHHLVLRYQTSKSNFKYEYANIPRIALDRLTEAQLESFDLVLADTDVLNQLGEEERKTLNQSIRSGLGLLILMNDLPPKGKHLHPLLRVGFKPVKSDTVHLNFTGTSLTIPVWPVVPDETQDMHIVTRSGNRILSAYSPAGFGKVAFQLLNETYRIGLEGNTENYLSLWTPLLEGTARRANESFKIKLNNDFPIYADEPLDVEVISSGSKPALMVDNVPLPMEEDMNLDDRYTATAWAGSPGWHQLTMRNDSSSLNFFVSEEDGWRTVRIENQKRTNFIMQNSSSTGRPGTKSEQIPVSPILFFVLFLLASGFLWLAPKI